MSLPYQSLEQFFDEYGTVEFATRQRMLGWAVHFGLMFTLLGVNDEPTYLPIGHRALDNALRMWRARST
jgi:hypothetical protein